MDLKTLNTIFQLKPFKPNDCVIFSNGGGKQVSSNALVILLLLSEVIVIGLISQGRVIFAKQAQLHDSIDPGSKNQAIDDSNSGSEETNTTLKFEKIENMIPKGADGQYNQMSSFTCKVCYCLSIAVEIEGRLGQMNKTEIQYLCYLCFFKKRPGRWYTYAGIWNQNANRRRRRSNTHNSLTLQHCNQFAARDNSAARKSLKINIIEENNDNDLELGGTVELINDTVATIRVIGVTLCKPSIRVAAFFCEVLIASYESSLDHKNKLIMNNNKYTYKHVHIYLFIHYYK
ncbi:hypothetical protein RFI_39943 [Reticulomyxa filosa]|uniref:Uncharacterized protein n=1 Tax=Reticulomyxa filosa TaxID=46433 RepID=X6L8Z5_RETFI|nr:hypothetical protein RFI_39943 [Reticulomyxa filosa]|eukprot:ETN97586.1 hypothetical protein RFI_39943 [Reticulomyxa filosa]